MKAIVPGSYDPVTIGHLDIIKRAAEKYEEVYAVVFINPKKTYRFTVAERERMLSLATEGLRNVKVSSSSGLVIDFMKEKGIDVIVKGYRNDADLEYERAQARWNKENGGFDTELLKCSPSLSEVSSTRVRNALDNGDSAEDILPEAVADYIRNK